MLQLAVVYRRTLLGKILKAPLTTWFRFISVTDRLLPLRIDAMLPVTVHIYRGSTTAAVGCEEAVGLHAGVEVHGMEYSYAYAPHGTGVFSCLPKGCEAHVYKFSFDMGATAKSVLDVDEILESMKEPKLQTIKCRPLTVVVALHALFSGFCINSINQHHAASHPLLVRLWNWQDPHINHVRFPTRPRHRITMSVFDTIVTIVSSLTCIET